MQWVDAHEAPKPLIVPMTTFQEIQIIELHNISWILIRGALLLNYGIPWFFMHTYNRFMEVNNFIIETNNSTVQLQNKACGYAILDVSGSYIADFGAPLFIDGAWKNSYGFP